MSTEQIADLLPYLVIIALLWVLWRRRRAFGWDARPKKPPLSPAEFGRRGDLTLLRDILTGQFSIAEVNALSHDLGIGYDKLSGSTHAEKITSLLQAVYSRDRLPDLLDLARQARPDRAWPELLTDP